MKSLTSNEKKISVEIIEVNPEKIIFKTTYPWAFCLNANQESKAKYYSLSANLLNCQKLQKIIPDYDFSAITPNISSTNANPPQLRDYQLEDVKFLSQLKSAAIFSE